MADVLPRADEDTSRDRRHWTRVALRYQRYLAKGNWSAENWVRYGRALKESGELNSAAHAYAMALSLEAYSSSDTHLEAGNLHEVQGDTQKAVQSYKSALKLNPENLDAADGLRVLGVSEEEVTSIIEKGEEDRRHIGLPPDARVLAAKLHGRPVIRRKWPAVSAAVIIVFFLVWSGTSMLVGSPLEIAEGAYRSALAEVQQPTGVANAGAEAAARKAAEGKATAEAAARKTADEKASTEAAARRAAEQKLAAEDARLKAEEQARKAAEVKPKSAAELREQAEKAEAALTLSEQDRKKVQVALNSLGHEMPTVTGYFGPRTRARRSRLGRKSRACQKRASWMHHSSPHCRSRPRQQGAQTRRMRASRPNGPKPP